MVERDAMQKSRLVTVDTESQRRFFARTFRLPLDKFRVHYLGPDFSLCSSVESTPPASGEVLHYGSYLPLHGVDVIVRAANILRDDPSLRFTLIGDGPDKVQVHRLVNQLTTPNIDFIDWLPLADLSARVQAAAIGLGGHFADNPKARRVIAGKTFQLLAQGIPTIIGDCQANHEIFQNGEHVVMVPMADPRALAEEIRHLAGNDELRERLRRSGQDLMREEFAPNRVSRSLRLIVEEAINTPPH